MLELLDISGSVVTIDAIGTQTALMDLLHEQDGHIVLEVKKNQPEAYDCGEIGKHRKNALVNRKQASSCVG